MAPRWWLRLGAFLLAGIGPGCAGERGYRADAPPAELPVASQSYPSGSGIVPADGATAAPGTPSSFVQPVGGLHGEKCEKACQ